MTVTVPLVYSDFSINLIAITWNHCPSPGHRSEAERDRERERDVKCSCRSHYVKALPVSVMAPVTVVVQ